MYCRQFPFCRFQKHASVPLFTQQLLGGKFARARWHASQYIAREIVIGKVCTIYRQPTSIRANSKIMCTTKARSEYDRETATKQLRPWLASSWFAMLLAARVQEAIDGHIIMICTSAYFAIGNLVWNTICLLQNAGTVCFCCVGWKEREKEKYEPFV